MMAPVIDDPLFWLMGALALGLSKGGFAGVGQIATPLMALFMPPLQAAALLLPVATAANYFGVWLVKRTPTILFYRIAHLMVFLISLELVRAGLMGMLGW